MVLFVSFFVRPESRFFVPTCSAPVTPRTDAVKAGRRSCASRRSYIASPRLDGGEHGVTLASVGAATWTTSGSGIRYRVINDKSRTKVLPMCAE